MRMGMRRRMRGWDEDDDDGWMRVRMKVRKAM